MGTYIQLGQKFLSTQNSSSLSAFIFIFSHPETMRSGSTLTDQPVEVLVLIFSQLDGVRDIDAVRKTCKYLNSVISNNSNETIIVRAMSKSSKFAIPANQSYDSILRIYPAELYSPTSLISYAWLRTVEQRMTRACSLSAITLPAKGYFFDDPNTGHWHSDAIHFLWRFLETSLKDLGPFLETLDGRMIIRMADALETAISCGLRASEYRSLPVPGTPVALSFEKIMCDMRRRDQLGSTRNFGSRDRLIQIHGMSRGHLLGLAEMFICGNPSIVGYLSRSYTSHLSMSGQIEDATKRDAILKAVKHRRLQELIHLNPALLEIINEEMWCG